MSNPYCLHTKPAAAPAPRIEPAAFGTLRRKCACGGGGSSGGDCAECKKKKTLQRQAAGSAGPAVAPPVVHNVLRSSGQPLDTATRAFFEPRFGHDFSKVRIHADAQANESARSVNALAYTVGPQIVLGAGLQQSGAGSDTQLLAHELAHVVQQSQADENPSSLRVGEIDSPFEKEADHIANAVVSNQPGAQPAHAGTQALQRAPAQTPTQNSTQAQNQADWGSKRWAPFEDDWNAFYQLAVQGLAGTKLKPEKMPDLAADIADKSMLLCLRHGRQSKRAVAATDDQTSKATLDFTLAWGNTGVWGQTFRSALQSTSQNVDGPISAQQAVQRAGDIADQAVRGMLGDALWKTYMNSKNPDAATSPPPATNSPAPKAAAPVAH
jgi:hypothetical protein